MAQNKYNAASCCFITDQRNFNLMSSKLPGALVFWLAEVYDDVATWPLWQDTCGRVWNAMHLCAPIAITRDVHLTIVLHASGQVVRYRYWRQCCTAGTALRMASRELGGL